MKKAVFSFIIGALLFSSVSAYAISQYTATKATFPVYVNGDLFEGTTGEILVVEGRTYLPIRDMAAALGIPIEWNNELRQVEVGTPPVRQVSEQSVEIVRGSWQGNTYTNEFGGFTFNMPTGWVYGSDEDIANKMEISKNIMTKTGAVFSNEILDRITVYDMAAKNKNTDTNIIIAYENLAKSMGELQVSETTYLGIVRMRTETENKNLEITHYTIGDVNDAMIGGESYKVLDYMPDDGDTKQYMYVRKIEKFMLFIVANIAEGDNLDEIMDCFK